MRTKSLSVTMLATYLGLLLLTAAPQTAISQTPDSARQTKVLVNATIKTQDVVKKLIKKYIPNFLSIYITPAMADSEAN